jgi:hypothetical protein
VLACACDSSPAGVVQFLSLCAFIAVSIGLLGQHYCCIDLQVNQFPFSVLVRWFCSALYFFLCSISLVSRIQLQTVSVSKLLLLVWWISVQQRVLLF